MCFYSGSTACSDDSLLLILSSVSYRYLKSTVMKYSTVCFIFPLPHKFVHLLPDHLTDWDCAAASAVNMMCKMLLGSMEQLDKTTQNKTEADIPLDRSHRTSNTSVILSAIIYMCTRQQCFLQQS